MQTRFATSCNHLRMWGLKGFKRWVFLGAVVTVVVLLAAAWLMRVEIIRTTLDPRVPFQTYKPPAAPDYAEARAWALLPGKPAEQTLPADVFFIGPTTYDGGEHWNAPWHDEEALRLTRRVMLPNYAGPFARVGRVFAPHYRQASLYSHLNLREDARRARRFAYADVLAAFRVWRRTQDAGRPLVVVGVEQGGLLADRLVREEIAPDRDLLARLAGVYLIETVVPAEAYGESATIPACWMRAQARCAVAWATPRERSAREMLKRSLVWDDRGFLVELGERPALCVNPLLGARSDAPAPDKDNLGAAVATGFEWNERPAFLQRQVAARCVEGVLDVSRPRSQVFKPARSWADRLKVPPYNLFYLDLEVDAQARVSALIGRDAYPKAAPPIETSIQVRPSPVNRID
ncbi:MAG: DUF3089 domain-containing protein [Caulobacter sp.]|nr:DUF3089 domain-containing protein [Caulobacter sp.]